MSPRSRRRKLLFRSWLGAAASARPATRPGDGSAPRSTVQRVAPGDTVQLRSSATGKAAGDPDLAPLRRDFDILGTSRSSSIQIVNGSTSRTHRSSSRSRRSAAADHGAAHRLGRRAHPGLDARGRPRAAAPRAPRAAEARAPGTSRSSRRRRSDRPYVQAPPAVTVRLYTRETLYRADLDSPATTTSWCSRSAPTSMGPRTATASLPGRDAQVPRVSAAAAAR